MCVCVYLQTLRLAARTHQVTYLMATADYILLDE